MNSRLKSAVFASLFLFTAYTLASSAGDWHKQSEVKAKLQAECAATPKPEAKPNLACMLTRSNTAAITR